MNADVVVVQLGPCPTKKLTTIGPLKKQIRIQKPPGFNNQPLKVDWNPRSSFQEQPDSKVLLVVLRSFHRRKGPPTKGPADTRSIELSPV